MEEREVQVHPLIHRAVERAHLRRSGAAAGLRHVGEEDGRRERVRLTALRELVFPELLHAVDVADDAAVFAAIRVRTGLAFRDRLLARAVGTRAIGGNTVEDSPRIDAEQQRDHEDHQTDPAAADDHATAARPAAAPVLDLGWVELGVVIEAHARDTRKTAASAGSTGFAGSPRRMTPPLPSSRA